MIDIKFIYALFLGAILLISASCHKDEPDECRDCIGAFRCEINGEEWGPDCDSGTILWECSAIDCQYYVEDGALILRIENEKQNQRFLFSAFALETGMTHVIGTGRLFIDYTQGNCGGYKLIHSKARVMEIESIDTSEHTIKGTFHFEVLSQCGDSLKIERDCSFNCVFD